MPRKDALVRLKKTLLARRTDLWETLEEELANLHHVKAADSTDASADVAFATSSDEISARLAQLDSCELSQIDQALVRLQLGTYGSCEGGGANCQKEIRANRLSALPYTTLCINCEREMEKDSAGQDRPRKGSWRRVFDSEAPMRDQRINFSESGLVQQVAR
jgi:DnaK suppressor protein